MPCTRTGIPQRFLPAGDGPVSCGWTLGSLEFFALASPKAHDEGDHVSVNRANDR